MRYATPFLLIFIGLAAPARSLAQTPESLLEQLASPDPKTRAAASDKLLSLGISARPAVLDATRSANPEVRARAADLILKLPWSKPSDPGEVQRVLAQYGQHDPKSREHDVILIANFTDHAGQPALVRLLTEDPSDPVRWAIVSQLHARTGTPTLDALRELDPADQPAPVLAAMALAYATTDQQKSHDLYQQAADSLRRDAAPAESHLTFAEILIDHGLRSLARKELELALGLPGPFVPLVAANAHFQLASIIGDSDDRAAADHIKAGIDAFSRLDGAGLVVDHANARASGNDALADLKAEMHFRYYRAAIAAKDLPTANQHLSQLLTLNPSRADVVLEVVPALKSLGRNAEAKTMFDRAYKPLKAAVDADPASAENLNNLAWLCARCDERPEEAVQLAKRALELSPDNSAYMDTAAEAAFHAGRPAEAVAFEQKALKLRPSDEFMQAQLKRFQSPTTRTTTPSQ